MQIITSIKSNVALNIHVTFFFLFFFFFFFFLFFVFCCYCFFFLFFFFCSVYVVYFKSFQSLSDRGRNVYQRTQHDVCHTNHLCLFLFTRLCVMHKKFFCLKFSFTVNVIFARSLFFSCLRSRYHFLLKLNDVLAKNVSITQGHCLYTFVYGTFKEKVL